MAAVTKNLSFGITASTSFEPPFLLAKRFSTLDHFTKGRIGWNIVTSWKKAAFKAIGLENPIEHDERYHQADEYLRVLYKYAILPLSMESNRWLTYHQDYGKAHGLQMRLRLIPRTTATHTQKRSGLLITRANILS